MENSTVVSIDQRRFLRDARHFFDAMARNGQFDEPFLAAPSHEAPAGTNSHYLALCTTIGLALTKLGESAPGQTYGELGRVLLLIASTRIDQAAADAGLRRRRSPRARRPVKAESKDKPLADTLSRRELAIITLIGKGQSNKEIARQLQIAPETVKTHMKRIFSKLGVEKRAQAVWRAHTLGLLAAERAPSGCAPILEYR